ncbi:GFA family protein [Zestomonas carbonaria]|uniref:CENP-V/GFA domain-containing protein n=1 Tax=Zestomonas carbonaria TaxID=2762745 RepID=A0A7U7ELX5_9GAMM|nr:hypothetical protein PSEWESI4_01702 [Pseudomonas carbonaria]
MTMSGSCLCWAVRYEITGSFKLLGNCHCSMCRKAHGAAFVTWGIVDPDQFHWGAGKEFVHGYESSPGNRRCFCKQCGSPLVSTHGIVKAMAPALPRCARFLHFRTLSKEEFIGLLTDSRP